MSKDNSGINIIGIPIIIGAYAIGFKGLWGREAVVYIARNTLTVYGLIIAITILLMIVLFGKHWRDSR